MELKLGETAYLDFTTHRFETGAVTDADSTPTVEVFEESTDTPIETPTATKRTSKTGNYRVPIVAISGTGYEAGKTYNVVASATVNSVTGKGVIGRFMLRARALDDLAYPATTGRSLDVDTSGRMLLQPTQTGVTIPTVTTLTNAPSDSSGVTTLLARLTATRAGYLDNLGAGAVATLAKVRKYLQLFVRKDAAIATDNATELTELNADGGSGAGAFDNTTDAQQALRDRGDAAWLTANGFAVAGDAMTLTTGERTAVANEVEAQIIDDTDSEKVLTAITDKIASVNPDLGSLTLGAIAAAVRDQGYAGAAADSIGAAVAALVARLPGSGTLATTADVPSASAVATATSAQVTTDHGAGSYVRNTEPLDAAGTRASLGLAAANLDTQLADLPTNAELAAGLAAADDAVLAAIAALNDLSAAQVKAQADQAITDAALATAAALAAVQSAVSAMKLQTDKLTFDASNNVAANAKAINDKPLTGDGSIATPWGPA